eukprot:7660054-Alexandrium_andersonii.AAC.1
MQQGKWVVISPYGERRQQREQWRRGKERQLGNATAEAAQVRQRSTTAHRSEAGAAAYKHVKPALREDKCINSSPCSVRR